MSVIQFRPWDLVSRVHDDMNRLFSAYLPQMADAEEPSDWTPRVDVAEEDARFVIEADLPGIDPQALDVSAENGVLTIAGSRRTRRDDGNGLKRSERSSGRFLRRFALPEEVDAERISAEYKDGVLVVSLPKHPEQAPRRIEVNVN